MYRHNANGTYSAIGYFADTTVAPGAATGSPVSIDLNQIKTIDLDVDVAKTKTYDYGYLKPGPQFNDSIKALIGNRTDITTIRFVYEPTTLTLAGLYSWNTPGNIVDTTRCPTGWKVVSTPNSPHKIWAYIQGTEVKINCWGTYIYANTNCKEMFKGLTTVSGIHWNNGSQEGFITEDVTDMSSMFEGDTALSTIDGIGLFNTTNVTNMAYMFKGCSTLQGLTLSSFNTQNVTDSGMVGMFQGCSKLQTLDIRSFTTARVTNMTNLFSGCTLLTTLDIRQFVISPNTTLTNMCYHLNYEHHWKDANGNFLYSQNNPVSQNRCNITCKTDTWNTIMGQAALPDADHPDNNPIDPTTGLDLRIVKKSDTNVGK
jgi:surface protein